MKLTLSIIAMALLLSACSDRVIEQEQPAAKGWKTDFVDDFDTFNPDNWQDQMIWVNGEHHCYVPDNQ